MFAGLGAWALFRQRDYLAVLILLLAISAMYVGTGLVRLLVYASIGTIVLASVGLDGITRGCNAHHRGAIRF